MLRAPDLIRKFTMDDLHSQIVPFDWNSQWEPSLQERRSLALMLGRELRAHGGISRNFVKSFAERDPIDLYLVALMFGYGDFNIRWPLQVQSISPPFEQDRITKIITTVQTNGSEAGWHELMTYSKIDGLGYAFGTKVLWAAGFECASTRKPLILDDNVNYALSFILGSEKWPYSYSKNASDYLTYIDLAEQWAADSTWNSENNSELVEYALFSLGKSLRRTTSHDAERDS